MALTCAAQLLGLSAAILSLVRPHGCEVVPLEAVEIQAEVGGSVQMDCDLQGYVYLYWQKQMKPKDLFVNGLAKKGKTLTMHIDEEYSNRSRVYGTNGTLELWNLKVSDTGYYKCVKVLDSTHKTASSYHLFVTARYTKPVLTTHSSANGLLEVTCSTWGGSPRYDIQWLLRGKPNSTVLWEKQPGTQVKDETDQLWNLTSTRELNCTQPLRISCAVGNTTSEELNICAVLPPPFSLKVIIAIVVVSAVAFGMLLAFLLKLRNRSSDGERAGAEQMPLRTTPDSSSSEVETSAGHVTTPQQDPV